MASSGCCCHHLAEEQRSLALPSAKRFAGWCIQHKVLEQATILTLAVFDDIYFGLLTSWSSRDRNTRLETSPQRSVFLWQRA